MLQVDEVEPLNEDEQAKLAKIETSIDSALKETRGSVGIVISYQLERVIFRLARMYADAGWDVSLEHSLSGRLLSLSHPLLKLPPDVINGGEAVRPPDDAIWVNGEGEKSDQAALREEHRQRLQLK
jgi:hypothetical protein